MRKQFKLAVSKALPPYEGGRADQTKAVIGLLKEIKRKNVTPSYQNICLGLLKVFLEQGAVHGVPANAAQSFAKQIGEYLSMEAEHPEKLETLKHIVSFGKLIVDNYDNTKPKFLPKYN